MMEKSQWDNAKLPTLYNKAKKALVQCATLDECEAWKNKAMALASYARQTNDTELFDHANAIKNRAYRRQHEILNGVEPKYGKGAGRPSKKPKKIPPPSGEGISEPSRKEMAQAAGMTPKDVERAHQVGNVSEKEFEENVSDPNLGKPKRKSKPQGERYYRPSALVDAVKIIADAKSVRAVESEEVPELLAYVEKAIRNLTKWAIGLRQRGGVIVR